MSINLYNTQHSNLLQKKSANTLQPNFMNYPNTNSSDVSLENDSLELSNQDNKKKKQQNTITKVLTASCVTGALILGGVLIHKKLKSNIKINENNITFEKFKNIEDAKKFAKEKLGVEYDPNIQNTDVVNYVNCWITKIYNQAKGKVDITTYPKRITNADIGKGALFGMAEGVQEGGHTLGINVHYIEHFDEFLESVFNKTHNKSRKVISETDFPELYNTDFCKKLWKRIRKFNNSTATFEDKIKLYNDLQRVQTCYTIVNGKIVPAQISENFSLWHELGHMKHWEAIPEFYSTMKAAKEGANSQIYNEFKNSAEKQKIAGKVSPYSQTNPLEFVAEVYAGLKEGCKFDKDVMSLYEYYHGPKVEI